MKIYLHKYGDFEAFFSHNTPVDSTQWKCEITEVEIEPESEEKFLDSKIIYFTYNNEKHFVLVSSNS